MITAELQDQWLQQHLNHMLETESVESGCPAWLVSAREMASHALKELPLLDRKQESWRYTSIENLLNQQFRQPALSKEHHDAELSEIDLHEQNISPHLIADLDSYRIVLVNGRYAPHLSKLQALPAGVKLDSLRSVLSSDPDRLAAWFGHVATYDENVFTALNTALVNDGVFLHVDNHVQLERPIEIIYLTGDSENSLLLQPRNLFVVDEGARATVIERFISDNGARYFHNHLAEIVVGNNATLNHYRIQDESRQAYHLSSVYITQNSKSYYHGTTLAFGSIWNRTEYHVRFKQEGAKCILNGLTTVGDQQLSDIHLDVRHCVPACVSRENFKGVLYGKGRAVFDGYILVDKQAQHSDAQLTNDNLLLTRSAEVDTKPQLEIYADDVKCSHGTTVGELDPEQIFYLRSRGIDEVTARGILCLGFASEIIDTIDVPALQCDAIEKLGDILRSTISTGGN